MGRQDLIFIYGHPRRHLSLPTSDYCVFFGESVCRCHDLGEVHVLYVLSGHQFVVVMTKGLPSVTFFASTPVSTSTNRLHGQQGAKTVYSRRPFPPLPKHCSPFRGNSVPLPLATARPTVSSPTRPPSLSRQMKGCTVHSSAPAYRESRLPHHTEENSLSTSLPLDAFVEVG